MRYWGAQTLSILLGLLALVRHPLLHRAWLQANFVFNCSAHHAFPNVSMHLLRRLLMSQPIRHVGVPAPACDHSCILQAPHVHAHDRHSARVHGGTI